MELLANCASDDLLLIPVIYPMWYQLRNNLCSEQFNADLLQELAGTKPLPLKW